MWRRSERRLAAWVMLLVFSLLLIIIRTAKFGFMAGKDAVLWLIFLAAAVFSAAGIIERTGRK